MIYLDNNATTQPTSSVVEAMLPYLRDCYFNASASTTVFTGADKPRHEAAAAMKRLLNAEEPDCFIFTSGATESNNWVFSSVGRSKRSGRVIISAIEHASVSEPASGLASQGFEVVEVPVDNQGVVRIEELSEMLTEDTLLVSIMAANNETGVLEPIPTIGRLIRNRCPAALFHTDATQAIGKIPVDLQHDWNEVDLLSFSAHKFHGPKGIGGLYIRPGIEIEPMLRGGGQERGLRSGTINTPALAGLAAAAGDVDLEAMEQVREQRDEFETRLIEAFPMTVIHSKSGLRLPNTCTFSLPGIIGEEIAQSMAAEGIIIGTGSACSAGAIHPPKTVLALGTPYDLAQGTLRISLSMQTESLFSDKLVTALRNIIANS
jgi:cysteine desulfurase